MISRKALAATGAAATAAVMFFGPAAMANAEDSGSASGSAELLELSTGSAGLLEGPAAGSSVLESGSGAIDGLTSAVLNIVDAVTGIKDLTAPAE
ncbi:MULTISPECIES: hypothetical protein [Nocardia]|uniref:Secreted protein n=2 Tax=Nocardia TaxID=1817 RepID=A0A4R6PVK8_NOCIG|nr:MULTISPECIES: hypothetical protein [Nocardia]MCA2205762.1 hypothetical protein [Nocardia rosealba]NKX87902.1 hypothetical protein [Nocardia coubleae]TDP42744.1 hypothetical protein DFR75_1011862 [Nocardia ignorata]